jgi:hypothetical protein
VLIAGNFFVGSVIADSRKCWPLGPEGLRYNESRLLLQTVLAKRQ